MTSGNILDPLSPTQTELTLAKFTNDQIRCLLEQKGLVFWGQGDNCFTTTRETAAFFGVGVSTVKHVVGRYKDNFKDDGLRVIEGKELNDLLKGIPRNLGYAQSLTLWTPRSVFRAALSLRNSFVAQRLRIQVSSWNPVQPPVAEPQPAPAPDDVMQQIEKAHRLLSSLYGADYAERMVRANLKAHFPHLILPEVS